jgi:hypothetical protein
MILVVNYFSKHACDFSLILIELCNFLYKKALAVEDALRFNYDNILLSRKDFVHLNWIGSSFATNPR